MTQAAVPAPATNLTSFACPVCGAHSTQTWFNFRADPIRDESKHPVLTTQEHVESAENDLKRMGTDDHERSMLENIERLFKKQVLGDPFLEESKKDAYRIPILENVFVSRCYTCGKLAIWLYDRIIYPPTMTAPAPNNDLTPDVKHDYEEARRILELSPRGAAALLRLAIEKMCIELKAEGADINQRIAFLVKQGLPELVQKALDTVRVIGNEAVHPGQLDLRDDREAAAKLFDLVNFIAEDRITRPKQIEGLYKMIPEEKRDGIDQRNAKILNSK